MSQLGISIIQSNIVWEDKRANLQHFEAQFQLLPKTTHVVFLPEMFSTGFSMNAQALAETMEGDTVQWLKAQAQHIRKIICGSIIIEEDDKYYNRLIWMLPNGQYHTYNKRHLFSLANEQDHYTAGDKKLIVSVNGWKLCLNICYDLRFPVWARQQANLNDTNDSYYDALVYIASWPERRAYPWKQLLIARAIENQAYVIGVNRVGVDNNLVNHSGDSCLIDPLGEVLWTKSNEPAIYSTVLTKEHLQSVREKFQFLNDADDFVVL